MHTIIMADGLTNDLCGIEDQYQNVKMNIGYNEIFRLFGEGSSYGNGIVPKFLRAAINKKKRGESVAVIFVRDSFKSDADETNELLRRYGIHDIKGTTGNEFVDPIKDLLPYVERIETDKLFISVAQLKETISKITGVRDFEKINKEKIKIFLSGVHTEKRVFQTAYILKNILNFPHIAVSPHLVGSSNREAHYNSFKYNFPDSLVTVFNNIKDIESWLSLEDNEFQQFDFSSCTIEPSDIAEEMDQDQQKIIEDLCMHWTKAELKPLKGGFSGSLLFLANGWKGKSSAEPMVIKVDTHLPIRKELQGYERVKDLLGNHVPSFAPPVSSGKFSGISMELATMEGAPNTLQDHFENSISDKAIEVFISLLQRTLSLLKDRIYKNTLTKKDFIPFRQFMLHIAKQRKYLDGNIDSILNQSIGNINLNTDLVKNMFDIIRKNDDELTSEVCTSHGDLNLANIICDIRENIWVIDWTYTAQHPIEMDFTKLENDIKFVISKNFNPEDFPNLRKFEEYLLNNPRLIEINELPNELSFVRWDLRFKKIYLAVKVIRETYFSIKPDENWLVYTIALLKYSIHTLSFDKSRNRGECEAIQLWFALASVEILVFKLIADDFHLKIRGAKPEQYPQRHRIAIDESNWNFECSDYNPPYYVDPLVLKNDKYKVKNGWAHSEDKIEFVQIEGIDKEIISDEKGYPLNPRGRTGLIGRGLLGRWGPNPYVVLVITRFNEETKKIEILLNDSENELRLTENFANFGETFEDTASGYLNKMFKLGINLSQIPVIYNDYLYDYMQTDNAWLFARSFLINLDEEMYNIEFNSELYPQMRWVALTPDVINQFSSNRASILRNAIQELMDRKQIKTHIAKEILNSTG